MMKSSFATSHTHTDTHTPDTHIPLELYELQNNDLCIFWGTFLGGCVKSKFKRGTEKKREAQTKKERDRERVRGEKERDRV